jgi:predicted unusual protein kinase regulating ubiquinone biosynthesis (AarF/ABC1/UbiB family)
MMLSTGLFHADAHPGNIMVLPKGVVGLIDYGQSKQLSDEERLLFARLVVGLAECVLSCTSTSSHVLNQYSHESCKILAQSNICLCCRENDGMISETMQKMGIATTDDNAALRSQMGRQMFGTAGKLDDPFSEDAIIRKVAITDFPKHYFLVLRVVQLIRGLATRMDIQFSTAQQWKPLAQKALKNKEESLPSVSMKTAKFYGI